MSGENDLFGQYFKNDEVQYSRQTAGGERVVVTTDRLVVEKEENEDIEVVDIDAVLSVRNHRQQESEDTGGEWIMLGGTFLACLSILYNVFPSSGPEALFGIGLGAVIGVIGLAQYLSPNQPGLCVIEFKTASTSIPVLVKEENSGVIVNAVAEEVFDENKDDQ